MKKFPYPLFMNLDGMLCVVVGGGVVAERKVRSLLDAGAAVRVISPGVTPDLQRLVDQKTIAWEKSSYRSTHLRGARLAIGATNDSIVNKRILADAERRGIPSNAVDDPENCRFIVPAVVRRGSIQVAIATGGGAPGITTLLKKKVEAVLTGQHATLVDLLQKRRPRIRLLEREPKERFWKKIATLPLIRLRSGKQLARRIDELLCAAEGKDGG